MIEKDFDISFIAALALREKQIQQNYRPIIAVHKWFARRPGTLFRGLLLSEFSDGPLNKVFYESNDFHGITVADPFMGGGTPLLEANRVGCNVVGLDINPMSYWIVKQELEHLDLAAYKQGADSLLQELALKVGPLYNTRCVICGDNECQVKYFLWVKTVACSGCGQTVDLFPDYLLASEVRHPKNVLVCSSCGELTETKDRTAPGPCCRCRRPLSLKGPAYRNRCKCPHCSNLIVFPNSTLGAPRHRLFAIEYYCTSCKRAHTGRFFKAPDDQDHARVAEAQTKWAKTRPRFVPDDEIPSGDETNRLHRWGYTHYHQMFNPRQLLALELSARIIEKTACDRVRNALATNLSDLLRYQNMLCRYDTMALKSLDIFSVHGFPVGLIQCESNFLGIMDPFKNACVGSGGWKNIIEKFRKAKAYCDEPFEIKHQGQRKVIVPVRGEWIGDRLNNGKNRTHRSVNINCADAATFEVSASSFDAVFTDPPYFGNVQYAELMDFCYVWLRRLVGEGVQAFKNKSTRNNNELTGNIDMGRGLEHFTEGLSSVFQRMVGALKPGGPLVFTYHHNALDAYLPVAVAILDAGLTCSASLPCPAEMGASIHINGTGSSIIDTVFVCRTTGVVSRRILPSTTEGVASLVQEDLKALRRGNVKPTAGDTRCVAYGHLLRLAIWNLRLGWNRTADTSNRIAAVNKWIKGFGGWVQIEKHLDKTSFEHRKAAYGTLHEETQEYGAENADVSF